MMGPSPGWEAEAGPRGQRRGMRPADLHATVEGARGRDGPAVVLVGRGVEGEPLLADDGRLRARVDARAQPRAALQREEADEGVALLHMHRLRRAAGSRIRLQAMAMGMRSPYSHAMQASDAPLLPAMHCMRMHAASARHADGCAVHAGAEEQHVVSRLR